jgi:hypothetical protein
MQIQFFSRTIDLRETPERYRPAAQGQMILPAKE